MSNPRAVKYRRLALAETDQEKVRLLQRLADEAEQGILVTSDWRRVPPPVPTSVDSPTGREPFS
jgi:hypothetical protein